MSGSRRTRAEAQPAAAQLRPVILAAERFVSAIEARSIALMLRLDLSLPQLRALALIHRHGRRNGRQLAAGLRLTPGAIVAICDQLEQRAYVRRVVDSLDRRITWFELTEQGADVFNTTPASTLAKARMKRLLMGMSPAERDGFVKIANAFADALESAFPTT